jgi:transcriptional repressor NrdR
VGALVLARLRDVDEMAFLRFASVYKDFKEIEDFEREMAQLEAGVEASDQQV